MFDTPNLLSPSQAAADMAALYQTFGDPPETAPHCEVIATREMPEPYRHLLAHHKHMTVTLEDFFDSPVSLTVLKVARRENHYARKILLSSAKTRQVVQFGIMRFNFDHCGKAVRDEILEGKTPLGRILINHRVLRRISTHALLKIDPNAEIIARFGLSETMPAYGRFATIFCNHEPAVDLLEVINPRAMKNFQACAQ